MNKLDEFVVSRVGELRAVVTGALEKYDVQTAMRAFLPFLDDLNNFYIRNSRENLRENEKSREVLRENLGEVCKLLAPFCPFISEYVFLKLNGGEGSVHAEDWPESKKIDENLNAEVAVARKVIALALSLRAGRKIRVRQPLAEAKVAGVKNLGENWEEIVKNEINVKKISYVDDAATLAKAEMLPDARVLGRKFGGKIQEIIREAKSGNFTLKSDGSANVCGEKLEKREFEMRYVADDENMLVAADGGVVVALDANISEDLAAEGTARDVMRAIQDARKKNGCKIGESVAVNLVACENVKSAVQKYEKMVMRECGVGEWGENGIKVEI